MIFKFGRITHAIFKQHKFFVDEFYLVLNLMIFLFHQLENILKSCNLLDFFSSFCLGLDFKSIFLL